MASNVQDGESRRDFLNIVGLTGLGVGVAGLAWPLIDQMNPSADVLALATVDVDLSAIDTGMAVTIKWRGKPVFIRNRTEEDIAAAAEVDSAELRDPQTDAQRTTDSNGDERPQWLVQIGVCTHLGCVPLGNKPGEVKGEYGGWFCPCHGSHYDTSGRIRKGPAPRNLDIPPYTFTSESSISIG